DGHDHVGHRLQPHVGDRPPADLEPRRRICGRQSDPRRRARKFRDRRGHALAAGRAPDVGHRRPLERTAQQLSANRGGARHSRLPAVRRGDRQRVSRAASRDAVDTRADRIADRVRRRLVLSLARVLRNALRTPGVRRRHAESDMRVAQLIESDGPGGAERVVADLATQLQADGAHSVVFVPTNGEGWLARQLEGRGVALETFHLDRPFSPACARSLAAAFRRHRVDVAHSPAFSLAVYGAWASWLAGVPHLVTMHGSRYYAGRLRRRVDRASALAAGTRTGAVSTRLADQMSRELWIPRARIAMVSNGVRRAPPAPKTVRGELGLSMPDRLLVAVGNLYPVKGHTHLIDAM